MLFCALCIGIAAYTKHVSKTVTVYMISKIYAWMQSLPEKFPDLATVESIGDTAEGRKILLITITKGSGAKPGVLINSLFHAREWITGATVTYMINELTTNHEENKQLLSKYRFYIIPVANPDGYEYSWTADRNWRKNRNPNGGDECKGVDLERNFDIKWKGVGSSSWKCSDTYRGTGACSENECQALVKFILGHTDIIDYYSFHSYGQIWMTPWSYTKQHAFNHDETMLIMAAGIKALERIHGTKYTYGSSTDVYGFHSIFALGNLLQYPIAATVEDWAMATAKINYSYCIELPDKGDYGFSLPPKFIKQAAEETWVAVSSMVRKIKVNPRSRAGNVNSNGNISYLGPILMAFFHIISFLMTCFGLNFNKL